MNIFKNVAGAVVKAVPLILIGMVIMYIAIANEWIEVVIPRLELDYYDLQMETSGDCVVPGDGNQVVAR